MSQPVMLPSFLYGRFADVSRACRKAATRFIKGASLSELPDALIDVATMDGYIVVEGPHPNLATEAHYQGYALVARLLDRLDARDAIWDRFLDEMLAHPWLIYCCLGQDSYFLFMGVGPARRFITAIRDQWEVLSSPGRRFLWSVEPDTFGTAAPTMWTSLRELGATDLQFRQLKAQLRSGGRPPLLDLYAE